jgi:hypothetical protein
VPRGAKNEAVAMASFLRVPVRDQLRTGGSASRERVVLHLFGGRFGFLLSGLSRVSRPGKSREGRGRLEPPTCNSGPSEWSTVAVGRNP